jgi:AbiU2
MSHLPVPDSSANADELLARLQPVWLNTYWVQNALALCEGIWKHGDELSAQHHGHFFGLVHNFALNSAVLGICKLFDRSNPRYRKNTIPDLFDYIKAHVTDTYAFRLGKGTLLALGMSDVAATKIVSGFTRTSDFITNKDDLIRTVEQLIPTCDNSPTLTQLFLVRDKFIAHQERMCLSLREQYKRLP